MLPSSNTDVPFHPNVPTRFSHVISYVDFNQYSQDAENHVDDQNNNEYPLANSVFAQRITREQTQPPPITTPRLINSSLIASSSFLKDTTINFINEKDEIKPSSRPIDDDVKQSRTDSTPPLPSKVLQTIITAERSQQTSFLEMSLTDDEEENNNDNNTPVNDDDDDDDNNHIEHQRNTSEQRQSLNSTIKQSSSDDHTSILPVDDEEESPHQIKSIITTNTPIRIKQAPKLKYTTQIPSSSTRSFKAKNTKSPSLKWSSLDTPRTLAIVPSITRRAVQGVLVQFFRNGDEYHRGVKIAINEFELKSWEAFLNYLNRQPKLVVSTGGIRHIYSLDGQEIRSIKKFQHRQSYIVASGSFIRTNYRHLNDSFTDESDTNMNIAPVQREIIPYWNTRTSVHPRFRSPPAPIGEQIFLLPYSKLNMYESLILNRNFTQTFEEWLQDQVTDLLSHYTNNEDITHLFGITKLAFTEIKSFSKLYHMIKMTDTFIGCTDDEYVHAKHYLATMKPSELFLDRMWPRKAINGTHQRYPSKRGLKTMTKFCETQPEKSVKVHRALEDAKITLNWIHGYNGEDDLTKTLYTLPENEILYFIGSICILYEPNLKQQRFYTKHTNPITCVNIHQYQSVVASSEIGSSKTNQRASIHIWDHIKLRTIAEIRKEQFGSFINFLSFSPKSDDNLLLIVSQDKPQIVLFIDWQRNELIYSITCKSDHILSVLFVFDTTEWIACISQQRLLFYHINWSLRPLRMLERRESEVQNVYTGAAACDSLGERLLVGDKVGSVHVWRLIDNEPKLVIVQENILENDVETIVPINQEAFVLANGENQIKIWNLKLNTIEQIRLNENIGPIQSICSIQQGSVTTALAIGTKSNYIISKQLANEQFDVIMRGHTSPSICTCGDKDSHHFFSISSDRYLFKWNNGTKLVEWGAKSMQPISCMDLHPERNIIVLGSETSKLLIYDTLSSYYIATITLKMNTGVKSVRFSPDGSKLAVGLQNGNVCIFDVLGNGDFHLRTDGLLQNDNAPVSTIIWSIDSKYLLTIYTDNDYNIWSIPSFEIIRGKSIENIQWHKIVHPIMCNILDKSTIDAQTSAAILSPNLVLCCGKDGQLRLFRNRYAHHSKKFQLGLGPIQNLVPSTTNNTFLLSMSDNPVIVEIQVNINSHV